MERDLELINRKLDQLKGEGQAHGVIIQILMGYAAKQSRDWRMVIDNIRMMGEWSLKQGRSETDAEGRDVQAHALLALHDACDAIHAGILRSESLRFQQPPGS